MDQSRFAGLAMGWMLSGAATLSWAAEPPCVEQLSITGGSLDVATLRASLAKGVLANRRGAACMGAQVELTESDGEKTVVLRMGAERVERRVSSVEAAATWVESWLEPLLPSPEPSHPPSAPQATAKPPGPSPTPAPVRPPLRVTQTADVFGVGTMGVGDDGSLWAGGELSTRLRVTSGMWLGAALGAARDTALVGPAGNIQTTRQSVAASARGGTQLRLAPRVEGIFGLGVGVTSGFAIRDFGTYTDDTDQGGILVEGLADGMIELTSQLKLVVGLAGRYRFLSARDIEDVNDVAIPPAMPHFAAELRLGLGWSFGGGP